jgi:hypothetical protein
MAEDVSNRTLEYQATTSSNCSIRPWAVALAIVTPTLVQAGAITAAEWPAKNWLANSVWFGLAATAAAILSGIAVLGVARLRAKVFLAAVVPFAVVQLAWLYQFTIGLCSAFGERM